MFFFFFCFLSIYRERIKSFSCFFTSSGLGGGNCIGRETAPTRERTRKKRVRAREGERAMERERETAAPSRKLVRMRGGWRGDRWLWGMPRVCCHPHWKVRQVSVTRHVAPSGVLLHQWVPPWASRRRKKTTTPFPPTSLCSPTRLLKSACTGGSARSWGSARCSGPTSGWRHRCGNP